MEAGGEDMNELMIQCDNGDTYDLDEWTDHCKQLGKCELGHHDMNTNPSSIRFPAHNKDIDVFKCKTCGQLFTVEGEEIHLTPAWTTINPNQLSVTEAT